MDSLNDKKGIRPGRWSGRNGGPKGDFPGRGFKGIIRPVVLAVMVGASIFFTALFLLGSDALSKKTSAPTGAGGEARADAAPAALSEASASFERYDFRISADDTFYGVMSLFDVPPADIYRIAHKAKPLYNLGKLKRGTVLRVYANGDDIGRVEYKFNEFDILVISKGSGDDDGYSVELKELPWEVKAESAAATITSSLYEAGVSSGVDPVVMVNFSDIFAWDVDFASDIRKGDTFSILYEIVYVEGRPIKTGKILAAEIINSGKRTTAIYYEDKEGGSGYYDTDGRSLRRTLLRSPLRYRRISSYFSRSRYHPILKQYRPHHGIDYAAPTGTPVESAGSGRVTFAGWKRGYGNYVVIKHNNSYSTAYGHLSRISKGIKVGSRVEQGDVIGLVGSTGISTGPHLHYEVRRGKQLINPLSIKPERNKLIQESERGRFEEVKEEALRKLYGYTTVVASKDEPAPTSGEDS